MVIFLVIKNESSVVVLMLIMQKLCSNNRVALYSYKNIYFPERDIVI
jgi:hypothetical protein